MEINAGTIFFYELILLSFLLLFKGAGTLRLKEHDSFSKRHLLMYIILCSVIFIISLITIYSFALGSVNWIYAILGAMTIAFSTVSFVKEDKIQENLSKKKDLNGIPKKKEKKETISEHHIAFEKRRIEESAILFSVPIAYIIALIIPQILLLSQEMVIYKLIDVMTAVAIGIISGIIVIAIKRKHVIILMTISTCTFLVGDAICKMGLLAVAVCAIFYSNIVDNNLISPKEKQKEDKDIHRITTLLQIIVFFGLGIYTFGHLSIIALIITAAIIAARAILKEVNLSTSLIPLATLFCINRIFPGIETIVGIVMSVVFYLMVFSVIINIKDIILKVKNIFKSEQNSV